MECDPAAVAWTHALLRLPPDTGEQFANEWKATQHRVEAVHGAPVSHDTEPAGAPRLSSDRG